MFVKASPNEFLVVGRKGKVVNRGAAASAFLWPGSSYVLIASTQQEATFEMTQETRDGIPLRFKGIAIYRVVRPEGAARLFNFVDGYGHEQIKTMIGHVCLGELRAVAAHMTMKECIEERKTTLTDSVAAALQQAVRGNGGDGDWGIEVDVIQVAQVFIVDGELRRQLEAEVRNQIKSQSELSDLRVQEEIRAAGALLDRKKLQEALETDREKSRVEQERLQLQSQVEQERMRLQNDAELERMKLENDARRQRLEAEQETERQRLRIMDAAEREALQRHQEVDREKLQLDHELEQQRARAEHERLCADKELEQKRIETDAPVRLLELARQKEILERELEIRRLQHQIEEIEVESGMLEEKARHELRKELLPQEQVPAIAAAFSQMLQGANLSIYGDAAAPLLSAFQPAVTMLTDALSRNGHRRAPEEVASTNGNHD